MSSKAWKVGNNIDTDLIIAARYLNDASDENMRAHCMEDVIPDYANTIAPGDVLVAGSNFGCGSSREHAPIAIKVAGTKCVIAESFARIFYRNAINIGLPIIESPEAAQAIDSGDELEVHFEEGVINNLTKNETYHFEKFPEFIQKIVEAVNLLNYVKAKVGQ
ncbi:MAG: 3-isopropylmalate dehydratase small subunit [Peptococcaceae bacterium]|nr:3-isopropylmalate dehydratase small subunit [Peptococcaceae bacterium]